MKKELPFSEDYLWMSMRYCIGRHTIASHMHASTIARDAYNCLSDDRLSLNAMDINREVYDKLHCNNWLEIDQYYNMDKAYFKPLYELYKALENEGIDSTEKLYKIKCINITYAKVDGEEYRSCEILNTERTLSYYHSVWDITDLEVWQRLASLFDKSSHKWCKLTNGDVVEYYEHISMATYGGKVEFQHYKIPVDSGLNFSIVRYIDESRIVEDNIIPENC